MNGVIPIKPREICLKIMEEVYLEGKFVDDILDIYLDLFPFEQQDRAFINKLVYGTIEYQIQLDYIISLYSSLKPEKLKKTILYILRLSVYQLQFMDRLPDYSVCNEAVKLAKKRKLGNLSGYVNGVLRNIVRDQGEITIPHFDNKVKQLSIQYSVPEWLVEFLLEQYEETVVEKIFMDSLQVPPLCVRHNGLKCSKDELVEALEKEGIMVQKGHIIPDALMIDSKKRLKDIQAFRDGLLQVQDESSMLVALVAKPQTNQVILDVCAAPGGKSTHFAELLNGTGRVISRDVSPKKLQLIQDNIERLGHNNIQLECFDARVLDEKMLEQADIVLTDVPCSGLGIIRKKPDIKYNITLDGITKLIALQREIMDTCSQYVKRGGVYVYSTCTINQQENKDNVKWFLENHPEFKLCALEINKLKLSPEQQETAHKGMLQLLPINEVSDGFFIAKMIRMA